MLVIINYLLLQNIYDTGYDNITLMIMMRRIITSGEYNKTVITMMYVKFLKFKITVCAHTEKYMHSHAQ